MKYVNFHFNLSISTIFSSLEITKEISYPGKNRTEDKFRSVNWISLSFLKVFVDSWNFDTSLNLIVQIKFRTLGRTVSWTLSSFKMSGFEEENPFAVSFSCLISKRSENKIVNHSPLFTRIHRCKTLSILNFKPI